ncbi:hypothetical protein [Halovivax sp.]|uniref:hypothetical protein n=1 Tax=Halovivax sp. TaxID=1935978 RepID=UPI0025BD73B9|nr:hypothetical protein [Halovivax sp.]
MAREPTIREATAADADAIQRAARRAWHATCDEFLGPDTVTDLVDSRFAPERIVAVGFYESRGFERVATERDGRFDLDRHEYEKRL